MINGYWIQQTEVLAGGKKFQNFGDNALDIEFNVPFSDKKEPDVADIYIFNLTDETIADIKKDGYVYLNAGYRELNNMANILTGEIESIDTKWEDLDKVTTIKVADGAKKWRTATLNKTYTENTKASQIMGDLAGAMGYEVVDITPKNDISYPLGKTIKGSCSESLKQLIKDTESKMFINKNRITIRDEDKGYNTGFVLNADSGLVDIPVSYTHLTLPTTPYV